MGHILGVAGDAAPADLAIWRQAMLDHVPLPPDQGVKLAEARGGALAHVSGSGRDVPLAGGGLTRADSGLLGAAEGMLDNRAELGAALELEAGPLAAARDSDLIHLAFRRWGAECVHRLLGDYVWACWDPAEGVLTCGRDHNGNSVLYWSEGPGVIAFSTCGQALQGLSWLARKPDQLALAATIAMADPPLSRTVWEGIRILPPAHAAFWQSGRMRLRRYWYPEDTGLWSGQSEEVYAEALAAGIQDAAVRMFGRAQSPALTLSAGLDSGALAWAWRQSELPADRLTAYCATPEHDTQDNWPPGFVADELPGARETAQALGLSVPVGVAARNWDPLAGIRYMLRTNMEPSVGVGNMYWIAALLEDVQEAGHDLLMTGQQGNGTVSWYGRPWSLSFRELATHRSFRAAVRHKVVRPALRRAGSMGVLGLWKGLEPWLRNSLLQPAKARQVHLREFLSQSAIQRAYPYLGADPLAPRLQVIDPGASRVGGRWAERGFRHGVRIRDATAAKDLVELCLSIPDRVWSGPAGADRWLARHAMRGRLPAEITDRNVRGRQASDLFQCLVAIRPQVDRTLEILGRDPAVTEYLDVDSATDTWRGLLTRPFRYTHRTACLRTVMPALGLGLFIQNLNSGT